MQTRRAALMTIGTVLIGSTGLFAVEKKKDERTQLTVKGLHCDFCAAKLCKALKEIPGVADAKADVKAGLTIITPTPGKKLPSPKAQWEMVEKAGFTPVKLTGPLGTFTSKPKS